MGKHSPEPWAILPQRADMIKSDKDGSHVLECVGHITHERTQANALRIIQCVNACEGMENPAFDIAFAITEREEWRREAIALAQDKAALIAGIQDVMAMDGCNNFGNTAFDQLLKMYDK